MKNAKTLVLVFLLLFAFSSCANAGIMDMLKPKAMEFATKSAIPQAEPIEYRALKIGGGQANIVLINRSDTTTYRFSAACEFLDARLRTLGDFYIPETVLAPKQQLPLKGINFNGDTTAAKANAKSLNWTIYKLEEVK